MKLLQKKEVGYEVCNHAYVKTIDKTYYEDKLKCRVLIEESTCFFCG